MNHKSYIFFFLLFVFSACKHGKVANTTDVSKDSLSVFFDAANNDSLKPEQRQIYATKIYSIISEQSNDSLNRAYYFKLANRYFNMQDKANYKKISTLIVSRAKASKDTIALAKAYTYIGDYWANEFISDSAFSNYLAAEKLYRALKDDSKTAKSLLSKSVLQFNEKDFVGAEKSSYEALKFLNKINNPEMTYDAYNLQGMIYNELSEYVKALECHQEALAIIERLKGTNYEEFRSSSMNNIGLVYQNSKQHDKAISYFQKALQLPNIRNVDPVNFVLINNNSGYSELMLGRLNHLPQLFLKNLKISESLKNALGIISSKIHLSEFYSVKKDSLKANQYAKDVYAIAKANKIDKYVLLSLKELSKTDPKNAARYSEEYVRINDSLQLVERQNRNKLARIEFETDEIITQKNQLVEQRKTIIYISLGIILLGVLIFIIRFQAAKNRELKLVQEQQKANEEIYQLMLNQQNKVEEVRQLEKKRIAQELHDGVLGKLFGTRMNLGVLNNKDDEKAKSERIVYIDELQNLEQEIREISHDLNSEKTAVSNNFVLMVGNFIETQRKVCKAAIAFTFDDTIEWNNLDNIAKINFYRILQEAFQNINKHANAHKVNVAFTKTDAGIKLDIQDDGVGFNYAKKKKGIGLLNMNSRITDSGGNMQIITAPGEGTLLQFDIPLLHPDTTGAQ